MAYPVISGNGLNAGVTLAQIHLGNASFRKDTATTHSQVMLVQEVLSRRYNPGTADGKYGNNTLNAVKQFQKDNKLTVDGVFGKKSLEKLEEVFLNGQHLDDSIGGCIDSRRIA